MRNEERAALRASATEETEDTTMLGLPETEEKERGLNMAIHKCDGCRYKGEHQEMMFRPFGVCTRELNLIEAEKAFNAKKCPYKQTDLEQKMDGDGNA